LKMLYTSWLIGARQLKRCLDTPSLLLLTTLGTWRVAPCRYDWRVRETIKHGNVLYQARTSQVNEETVMIRFLEDSHKMFQDVFIRVTTLRLQAARRGNRRKARKAPTRKWHERKME
jgi:hypothetical protein